MTVSDDEERQDEDPLLDWELSRYLFWFALFIAASRAASEVSAKGVSGLGVGTLAAFHGAFIILDVSGRLKNWPLARRIASALFALAWIAFLIAYGQARGWF